MVYILIVLVIFLLDQKIKDGIEREHSLCERRPILKGNILITKQYNKGAFLGFLKTKENLLFIINIFSIVLLGLFFLKEIFIKGSGLLKTSLAFIVGGALSNFYDRVKRKHVIDYFYFEKFRRVVFNIADMFIFVGGIIFILYSLIFRK
ncbi:MAG: signal peptidase II [Eubacteriales bacterium]